MLDSYQVKRGMNVPTVGVASMSRWVSVQCLRVEVKGQAAAVGAENKRGLLREICEEVHLGVLQGGRDL